MPLLQLHHQFKNRTEFIAQVDRRDLLSDDAFREWVQELVDRHPLPKGARWMLCNDKSQYFVKQETANEVVKHG